MEKREKGRAAQSPAAIVFWAIFAVTLGIAAQGLCVREYGRALTAALTLLLLFVPPAVEKGTGLRFPCGLRVSATLFVFAAGILGEIGHYYQRFAFFDTILHAASGFLFAAFGFGICAAVLEDHGKRYEKAPSFFAVFSFCFAAAAGVLWELLEFAADRLFCTDMQKDTVVTAIHSALLRGDGEIIRLENITSTEIQTANGASFTLSGYLDIGLADTMEDLLAGLCGALVFCVIGYLYRKRRRGRFAAQFIPAAKKAPPPS